MELELKKAIKIVEEAYSHEDYREFNALQSLISLASKYLSISGWPEEKEIWINTDTPNKIQNFNAGKELKNIENYGYNKGVQASRLAVMKKLEEIPNREGLLKICPVCEGKKEWLVKSLACMYPCQDCQQRGYVIDTQAITKHIMGGER